MKRFFAIFLCALALIGFSGCKKEAGNKSARDGNKKASVVVTNFPCYDFARACIGDLEKSDISLKLLIKPGMEVHTYDPTPQDVIAVQNADLFVFIGGESDEWVEKILTDADKKPTAVLKLMDKVDVLPESSEQKYVGHEIKEHDEHDEDEHHHHHEFDEHIWTSSINAKIMINAILEELCALDQAKLNGANSENFTKNAENYCNQITQLSSEIHAAIDSSKDKLIVVGDRFPFKYFAAEYGLEHMAAFAGCSSAVEAKTSTVASLVDFAKEKQVPAIFYLELSSPKLAQTIAEGASDKNRKIQVLQLHSCHNVSKDEFDSGITYVDTMKINLENLKKGLRYE
ncbi:MAG: metal ABC transporter substrate-binding protein [Treponemataceae bacterium]|nr:metal ABC transporter substrate-binding protein [Treponemataceae bacterium]